MLCSVCVTLWARHTEQLEEVLLIKSVMELHVIAPGVAQRKQWLGKLVANFEGEVRGEVGQTYFGGNRHLELN